MVLKVTHMIMPCIGLGDKLRGNVMNALDGGPTNDSHPVAARGQAQAEQGMSRLSGTGGSNAATTGVGSGAANTGSYVPSGAAGAGGASAINSGAGGGTGGALPQGQYEGEYPSQGGAVPADRRTNARGGRNDREFGANYGGTQNSALPRQGSGGAPPDATNSGPGTGVPAGGPQALE